MLQLRTTERIQRAARNALLCLDSDRAFCTRLCRDVPGLQTDITTTSDSSSNIDATIMQRRSRGASQVAQLEELVQAPTNAGAITSSTTTATTAAKGVSLSLLEELSQRMLAYERTIGKTTDRSQYWLHELLRDSGVWIEPQLPLTLERHPQLESRLATLRANQANREYAHMVREVAPQFPYDPTATAATTDGLAGEARQTQRQLVAILNVLFSIAGVFTAVYWSTGLLTDDMAWRVLWSMLASLLVAIAESWLYVRYFNNNNDNNGDGRAGPLAGLLHTDRHAYQPIH